MRFPADSRPLLAVRLADGYPNWDVGTHRGRTLRHELPPGELFHDCRRFAEPRY